MHKIHDLFDKIVSKENFYNAYKKALKGKKDHASCKEFMKDPDINLENLRQAVINGTWKPAGYSSFKRFDGNKVRDIDYDPEFADNIVQHAIALQLLPLLKKSYIRDTYSGITGRGIHDGVTRVHEAVKSYGKRGPWIVKIDIHHFYPNINIEVLKYLLNRHIRDKSLLALLYTIVDSHPDGLPIGNYLSQHLANFYLTELDHYMKEKIRCKHYFRYCDDIVILTHTKSEAKEILFILEDSLYAYYLSVKPNKQVYHISRPGHLDFLGYIFYGASIKIRRSIERDLRSAATSFLITHSKHDAQALISYWGWLRWTTAGYKLWQSLGLDIMEVKEALKVNTKDLQDAVQLTDLCYNKDAIRVSSTEILDMDIIVVDTLVFKNKDKVDVLKITFYKPNDEHLYFTYTRAKLLIAMFSDIKSKLKDGQPFKARITKDDKLYKLVPTETI